MKFADLPRTDQPNYRLQELGPQSLATSELLAVAMFISESETASELAALYHEYGSLVRIPREKILTIKGLSNGYANAIKAIWELGRREANAGQNDRPIIHSPSDAANLVLYDMSALEQEEMRVIMLDTRNRVIRIHTCYRGSLNSAQVRIGELFKEPIRNNAAAVVVVHNHPSGDPTPSPDDVAVTRAIVQAGKLMDIDLLDHIVVGGGRYISLKERGLGF